MSKAFTEQEKEIINNRLMEQGCRLFSAYGLKKTNVEEITRAAGISKGAFYSFYESKEALFMDVVEQAEIRARQQILAMIDAPGPSPRARMFAILKKAFALFKTLPILQLFTNSDYDLLFRRIPPGKIQEHMASDRVFFDELVARCQNAGIPIKAKPEQVVGLIYPLIPSILQEDDAGQVNIGNFDLLLELIAAFCLGEVECQLQNQDISI